MKSPREMAENMIKGLDPEAIGGLLIVSCHRKEGGGKSFSGMHIEHLGPVQIINVLAMATHLVDEAMTVLAEEIAPSIEFDVNEIYTIIFKLAARLKKAKESGEANTIEFKEEKGKGGDKPRRFPRPGP